MTALIYSLLLLWVIVFVCALLLLRGGSMGDRDE